MSTRILILKDGVITPTKNSTDTNAVINSLGVVDLSSNQIIAGVKTFTNTTQSTSTTSGALQIAGGLGVAGNQNIGGFTTLGGNIPIKIKRVLGTTGPIQGDIILIPHLLSPDKILGVTTVLAYDPLEGIGPGYYDPTGPGYAYVWWYDATNINVLTAPSNSSFILNKPVRVLIFYTS